jgi:hypothetical protein
MREEGKGKRKKEGRKEEKKKRKKEGEKERKNLICKPIIADSFTSLFDILWALGMSWESFSENLI